MKMLQTPDAVSRLTDLDNHRRHYKRQLQQYTDGYQGISTRCSHKNDRLHGFKYDKLYYNSKGFGNIFLFFLPIRTYEVLKGKWQQNFLSSHLKETPKQYIKVYYRIFISALFGEIF